jgi:hypothetical protein
MKLDLSLVEEKAALRRIEREYGACASCIFQGEMAQMAQEQDMSLMESHMQVLIAKIEGEEVEPEELQWALEFAGFREPT